MPDRCPKCDEPLITRTIKKEFGMGRIDIPIAQICPKCNFSKDMTGAGEIVPESSAPERSMQKEEMKISPPQQKAAPPKVQHEPSRSFDVNKLITILLAVLVLGGIAWAFFLNPPAPEKIDGSQKPAQTAAISQTPVQTPTSTAPEVTPTGKALAVKLDSRRGFNPDTQTIKSGDEIFWINEGTYPVTLVSSEDIFEDRLLDNGKRTNYLFKTPGTYVFYLKENKNLTGTIIVEP